MTFTVSFGGRFSWPLRCAKAPTDTTPSINITSISRISLIIFQPFSSFTVPAHGREKELRRPASEQERCHETLGESLTVSRQIRTVSNFAAPYRARRFSVQPLRPLCLL